MIPIKDDNPTHSVPIITYLLILVNVLVFIFQTLLGSSNEMFVYQFALIPADVTNSMSLGNLFDIFRKHVFPLIKESYGFGSQVQVDRCPWRCTIHDIVGFIV